MIDGVEWPAPGDVFNDGDGRTLEVTQIQPKDGAGRHVVGIVVTRGPKGRRNDYACDLQTFRLIWKQQAKRF